MTDTETQAQDTRPAYEREADAAIERQLAAIKAHPSYEPLKAANPHREPSVAELAEHAEALAFEGKSKREKVIALLESVLVTMEHQVKHNAPVTPDLVRQIQAIRGHLDD